MGGIDNAAGGSPAASQTHLTDNSPSTRNIFQCIATLNYFLSPMALFDLLKSKQ